MPYMTGINRMNCSINRIFRRYLCAVSSTSQTTPSDSRSRPPVQSEMDMGIHLNHKLKTRHKQVVPFLVHSLGHAATNIFNNLFIPSSLCFITFTFIFFVAPLLPCRRSHILWILRCFGRSSHIINLRDQRCF